MVVKKSDRKINAVFGDHFDIPDIAEYVIIVPSALKPVD